MSRRFLPPSTQLKLTRHLRQVDESYAAHAKHALWFAVQAQKMALALLIHAALPFLFTTYGSNKLTQMFAVQIQRNKDKRK